MTHKELLAKIDEKLKIPHHWGDSMAKALRAVVELHKPIPVVNENRFNCVYCQIAEIRETPYPCDTIQVIQKELA